MPSVAPESWMPLRCMTKVIGAPWTAAPLKPLSAWPRDVASVATVADDPAAFAALSPLAEGLPTATGIITPSRPPLS